ncbi:DUF4328 domain-containing protein [Kitasatospora sp. NPDC058190]|uniref:DUF4328 domain-containing protein n=1 Tax=Kitasatospora sp. NPDC058190 TaxID=3346371 RepID=UPI0036DAD15E
MDSPQQDAPLSAGPVGAQRHRAVVGLGVAATVLILATLVYDVLLTVADWRVYLVVEDYLAGKATADEVLAADDFSGNFTLMTGLAVMVAAGLVFMVWLWRARINAERLAGRGSQRRARAWVVAGWTVPVANLWVPYQVVSDVWRASSPGRKASRGLISVWWAAWVLGGVISRAYLYLVEKDRLTEDDLRQAAVLSTVTLVADLVAGAVIIHVLNRISSWQTQRRSHSVPSRS